MAAAVVGGIAGAAPSGGLGVLVAALGGSAVAVGQAAVAQGMLGISAGVATMQGSLSLSTGGGGQKIPDAQIKAPPNKRGNAPTGSDGNPVELHHRGQKPDSPLDEMTQTEHRGQGKFKENHANTGQHPSEMNREAWRKERNGYWEKEWDNGRFKK